MQSSDSTPAGCEIALLILLSPFLIFIVLFALCKWIRYKLTVTDMSAEDILNRRQKYLKS
jgi:hypothetical protein